MANPTPRRWNTNVDGIVWLPRMIDKARMSKNGTLGSYLMGHSPVDFALLKRLSITTDDFVELANAHGSDNDVLQALRARGFDEAAVRAWSAAFPTRYAAYIRLWDLDEGYRAPSPFEKVGITAFRPIEGFAMGLVRRVRSAP